MSIVSCASPVATSTPKPSRHHHSTHSSSQEAFNDISDLITQVHSDMGVKQHSHDNIKSHHDLQEELYSLRKHIHLLCNALQVQDSLKRAADAHCTIMKRTVSDLRMQLTNMKKQTNHGSTKVKAWFLTLPELKDSFEVEEAERAERQRITADKDSQKAAEQAEREAQIQEEASGKIFELPLNSYKCKDDLRTIARALNLSDHGLKVADLTESIRTHLDEHPELQNNPRFSSLFASKCQWTTWNQPHSASALDDESPLATAMPPSPTPQSYISAHSLAYWKRHNCECKQFFDAIPSFTLQILWPATGIRSPCIIIWISFQLLYQPL